MSTGGLVLGLGLLLLGGFLAGGTISAWGRSRVVAAVLGVLAALAVAAGILRLLPA